jgi:hypothetical protein
VEWPARSGAIPQLAEGFIARQEVCGGLEWLPDGMTVALALAAGAPGAPADTTQLTAYAAGEPWRARAVDLLAWVEASSRASALIGYLQVARQLGMDSGDDAEAVAARVCGELVRVAGA